MKWGEHAACSFLGFVHRKLETYATFRSFALFFGFAAAMLGISGFESSANFVEEQADGVFPKPFATCGSP